jgi:rubrerythrin
MPMTDEVEMPESEFPITAKSSAAQETGQNRARESDDWKRRDYKAKMLHFMVNRRSRLPGWCEEAISVLAAAEAGGVRVLEAAIPAIADAKLRRVMLKHIEDEKRHTKGFTDFANQLNPGKTIPSYDSTTSSTNVLDFFAFLEITELRGEQMIQNYRELYCDYPEIQEFMDTVIHDERFHASYLHAQLENWVETGLKEEVAAARRAAAAIDARGFRIQLLAFIRTIPRLIWYPIQSLPSKFRGSSTAA